MGWKEEGWDVDPRTVPIYGAHGAPAATSAPARAPSSSRWREEGWDVDPSTVAPYGTSTDVAAPPAKPKSTLIGSAIRGTGQVLSAAGRAAQDIGLPTKGLEDYGTKLEEEHPADVTSLSDVLHHPIQTIKETAGELAPQIGLNLAGAFAGARAGGAIGGALGEGVGAVPGAAIGGLIGGFAPNFIQEYGGIRQTQDQEGTDNVGKALLAGGAAAAVDLLEPETILPRKLVTGGVEAVEKKGLKAVGKAALKDAAKEAAGEAVQSGLERFGADQDLTGSDAATDYGLSAIKGAIGGGAIGAVGHVIAPHKAGPVATPTPDTTMPVNDQSEDAPMVDASSKGPAVRVRQGDVAGPPTLADHIEAHLREVAGLPPDAPTTPTIATLATAISQGGDTAATALGTERASIDQDHETLLRNEAKLTPPQQDEQMAELAQREKVLVAAHDVVAQLGPGQEQAAPGAVPGVAPGAAPGATPGPTVGNGGINLITEPMKAPFGRRPTMPGEPDFNPNPDLPRAAETTLADRLRQEEANSKSARNQMEQPAVEAAQSAAEKAARGKLLGRVTANRDEPDIHGAFQQHLQNVGLSPELTVAEKLHLDTEQTLRRGEAVAEARARAADEQAKLGEQDTDLGVKERPTPAPEPIAQEPTVAAPEAAPAAEVAAPEENIQARAEAHAKTLGSSEARWFEKGVAHELGTEPIAERNIPKRPSVAKWFESGREFVTTEGGHQAREGKAAAPPERLSRRQQIDRQIATQKAAALAEKNAREGHAPPGKKPAVERAITAKKKQRAERVAKTTQPAAAKKAIAAKKPVAAKATPKPTTPTQKLAAKLVAERAAAAAKAKADSDTEARDAFHDHVDKQLEKGVITQQQAVQLRTLADMQENPDEPDSPYRFSVKDLGERLDYAENERAKAAPKVKAQQVTRRGLLRGTPGVIAAGLSSVKAEARTPIAQNTRVSEALKTGSLHGTVEAIAATTKNPAYRMLARAMMLGGFAKGARIEVWDMGDSPLQITGITDVNSGHVKVFHTTKGATGLSEETILHEALHSWVAARYGELATFQSGKQAKIANAFINSFQDLHQQFATMMDKKFPEMVDRDSDKVAWWAHFAAADPDEFFVRMFTEPHLQDFLRTHNIEGEKVAPANPTSIWAKLVRMVRSLFGIKPPTSILDKAMDAGWAVMKSGTLDTTQTMDPRAAGEWTRMGREEGGRQMFQSGKTETAEVRSSTDPGKTKAMMLGIKSRIAEMGTLAQAKEAIKTLTPEEVRQKFGWMPDGDGHWKFEISDRAMKLKNKFWEIAPGEEVRLGDVLDHPTLFKAYPELADMPLIRKASSARGWFDGTKFNVAPGETTEAPMILAHEIQHAVQKIEGFARGGSPKNFTLTNTTDAELGKLKSYYERQAAKALTNVNSRGEPRITALAANKEWKDKIALIGQIENARKLYNEAEARVEKQAALVAENAQAQATIKETQDAADQKAVDQHAQKMKRLRDVSTVASKAMHDGITSGISDAQYQKLAQASKDANEAWEKAPPRTPRDLEAERAARDALKDEGRKLSDRLRNLKAELKKNDQLPNELTNDLYGLLSGEVEARATHLRVGMSEDMIRSTARGSHEDILPSEQIVRFGSDGGSLKYSRMSDDEVTKRVTGDPPPIPKTGPLSTSPAPAGLPPRMKTPEAIKVRSAVHQAASSLTETAQNWLKKGFLYMAETEDIVALGKRYMPSLVDLDKAHSRGLALGRDMHKQLVSVDDRIRQLPANLQGTKPGSISDFLADSTTSGKWGFTPDWVKPSEVDPALVARFNAIEKQSPEAAAIIKEMFKFNHDARVALGEATLGTINAEYAADIKAAEDAGNAKLKAQLEQKQADAIKYHSRTFNTQEGLPYMSTARQGAWAVMGRSEAYRAAVEADDHKAIDKMRDDPEHLYVNFYDTAAQADVVHGHLLTKFGKEGAYKFERGKGESPGISSKEMLMTLKRFETAMDNSDMSPRQGARMKQMARDFYLHTLSENSARKAELHRENVPFRDPVTHEVLDMVDAFLTRGAANANYIASLSNHGEIQKALAGMRKEVSRVPAEDSTNAHRFFNEVMNRYEANLGAKPNRVVDNVVKGTSMWMLTTSPFYHMQNATQAGLISQPYLAKHIGYAKAWVHLKNAYQSWMEMVKGVGITSRIDYDRAPEGLRDLLHELAGRGRLDSGLSIEDRPWYVNGDGVLPKTWNKFDLFMRMLPQRIETMNRVVTGIAAYNGMIEKGKSKDEATDFASEIIRATHGNYSGWNSSRVFQSFGGWGKVAGQFRKFSLIMAANVVRDFHTIYKGATMEEKLVGIKGLAFLSAHTMAVGGILGLPGASFFGPMIAMMMNAMTGDDKDDWSDWKDTLRKALGAGDEKHPSMLADVLFKGAPYSLGADTSDRIGLGTMLSLAPFTGVDEAGLDKAKWYSVLGQVMLGPAGNVAAKALGGFDYGVNHDDWSRMAESLMPGFAGSTAKAMRLKGEGLVNKAGLQLIKPEDISWGEAALIAAGVNPSKLANQADRGSALYDATQFYEGRTSKLKVDYVKAFKAHDASQLQDIREEWAKLQKGRREDGFKAQPLSQLIRAPHQLDKRQGHIAGGVEYSKSNRQFVLNMLRGQDDAEDEAAAEP